MGFEHDSDSVVEISPPSPSSSLRDEGIEVRVATRDKNFYFSFVIFQVCPFCPSLPPHIYVAQVEDALYNVPRQPFMRESDVFHDMFSLPVPVGRKAEGQSDEEPVLLQSVSKVDFERLLNLMFPE